jgi:hypothetical protein
MATNYTIYLVNQSSGTQIFSCFLQRPAELAGSRSVFDVTNLTLGVPSNSKASNYFVIPQQFVVAAGASNQPVGANAQIVSNLILNADLSDQFSAAYVNSPPNMAPTLTLSGQEASPNQISIASNGFNQGSNENLGWFSNMSFGVNTASGFMGMTWSPSPAQTTTLTPLWGFSVTAKAYNTNYLALFASAFNNSAQLIAPNDFQYGAATVTYTATGGWQVTPGKPAGAQLAAASIGSLADAHRFLARAHSDLITLVGEEEKEEKVRGSF